MSRCFPFPPPGYERKARNDNEDLLEKEKNRDKKPKKEKKDKEKKESKEKREKDRSDGKHREKKDKKEKNRDKEKDKDRDKKREKEDTDKSKDKSKASDEKRLSVQTGPHVGEKFVQKESKEKINSVDKKVSGQIGGHKVENLSQNSNLVDESKFVKDFGRRIKDDTTATGNHLESFSGTDRKKEEGMVRMVAKGSSTMGAIKEKEKRAEVKPTDMPLVRDVTRLGGNAIVQNSIGTIPNKADVARLGGNAIVQNASRTIPHKVDITRLGGNAIVQNATGTIPNKVDVTRLGGNAAVQNATGTIPNKVDGLPRLVDKNAERKMEGNEKPKDKEIDDKRGVKSQERDKETGDKKGVKSQEKEKEKEKEKKSHGKDKERDREKKKEDREKRKEDKQKKKEEKQRKKEDREKKKEEKAKTQLQNADLDKLREINQLDLIDNHAVKTPQLPEQSNSSATADANPKKRKDFETNGVVTTHDVLPNKLPRLTPSSQPPLQNGRILEHCQTSVLETERKVASNNIRMENTERKINGVTEAQPPSVSPMKVKPATSAADQTAKPSTRPPHPDTKYLSQIYSVPNMEEWCDYDDQEWLFSSDTSQPKQQKVDPPCSEETIMVWAEAQQIESADIFALPYVVPY